MGKDVRDGLTVETCKNPGARMLEKAKSWSNLAQFQEKGGADSNILLDTSLNTLSTIIKNIYFSLLIAAMKFHSYARCLAAPPPHNPAFFFRLCLFFGFL